MNWRLAEAVVKPNVGKKMTMKSKYQNVFFMIEWFSPDLQKLFKLRARSGYAVNLLVVAWLRYIM